MVTIRTPRAFGVLIRRARQDRGWTQADLAEKLGKSSQWVLNVEKGVSGLSLVTLLDLLRMFDLKLDVTPAVSTAQEKENLRVALDLLGDGGAS